jgi:MinD-like ATPase involved in chromosome partitioning or flagellar assembly
MAEQFVVLGLARSRCSWFSELARWSTSAVAPIEYIKCLTPDEARAVIGSGRRLSALVVDAGIPRLDRDLVALATSAGAATLVVDDGATRRDWDGLGCAAVLPGDFGPDELVELLVRHASPVDRSTRRRSHAVIERSEQPVAPMIGVTGAGGVGASTVAMALAQALAATRSVALADGARDADLAMYHDVGDVIPGLPELVEAHRIDRPDPTQVRELLFHIESRNYQLLLGQRRRRDSAAMHPGSVAATIDGLRRSFDVVIVDHDPDVDGEEETGSIDIEERHALARHVVAHADLVVLVGRPGVKGLHDMLRHGDRLVGAGLPVDRLLPVLNHTPRQPAVRAAATRALAELRTEGSGNGEPVPPLFLRPARGLEEAHRSATRLPEHLARPLERAVRRQLLQHGPRAVDDSPQRLVRGELGSPHRSGALGAHGVRHHRPGDRSDVA